MECRKAGADDTRSNATGHHLRRHTHYCTFNKYRAIEVYGEDYKDEIFVIQIYAPVVKK